jgi:NADPH-dependent 2,4-dienoyl-CoA reductase/sulfur reductase-like enzyme
MTNLTRREMGLGLGAAVTGTTTVGNFAIAQGLASVVIIGGGPGGATVAHQLKTGEPKLDITLIEVSRVYTTCFFSNLYLGGFRSYQSLQHGYDGLRRLGVKVVHALATDVDTTKRIVRAGKQSFSYDRLVVAPGIDLKYDSIEGYSAQAAQIMPHAYLPGAQTQLLKRQLDAMRNGGTVVMAAPNNPYRCPPGPYERACMIAHFLKTRKPKSKLVILDPKRAFSKQPVFMEAFDKYYKGIVEVNLTNEIDDFAVAKVDAKTRTLTTKAGKSWKADVANIIPQQRAGAIVHKIGLNQGDWCPVNAENFSSTKVKDVYVLGDSSIAAEMPKSAFSANSQAKVVAADILAVLAKKPKFSPNFRNTCWSLLAPNDAVKIGAGYVPKGQKLDPVAPFVSKPGEGADLRRQVYQESLAWYDGIVTDTFAKGAPGAKGGKRKKSG